MNLKPQFFLLLGLLGMVYAQVPTMRWVTPFNGGGSTTTRDLRIDPQGNVFTIGHFDGTLDIDPGPGTTNVVPLGNDDGFVHRLDSNGTLVWFRQLGGTGGQVFPRKMAFDASGNLVITGSFYGTIDFDPGPSVVTRTSFGWDDAFVLKLTAAGALVWVRTMGGSNASMLGRDVVIYPNGDVLMVGNFRGNVDADPSGATYTLTNPYGTHDAFLLWLSDVGNFVAASSIGGGTTNEYAYAAEIDGAGNAWIQGEFGGTRDFDPGTGVFNLTASGTSDIWVLKLNALRSFVWAKRFGGSYTEFVSDMCLSPGGNLYLHGTFYQTVDFDPGAGVANLTATGPLNGNSDGFVAKWDGNGNFVWVKHLDAGYNQSLLSGSVDGGYISVDAQERVLLADHVTNSVDLDPSPTVIYDLSFLHLPGSIYRYLLQLDASGNFEWAELVGGIGPNFGGTSLGGLKHGPGKTIFLAGEFYQTVDFNIGPGVDSLNGGVNSLFVEKFWGCNSSTTTMTAAACDSFAWRGQTYTASGTYYDVLSNVVGCDSILKLELTIGHPTTHALTATSCGPYSLNGTTYSASGTYTQTLQNTQGCDSILTLNLTVNSPSASTLTATACASYTLNGQTYTSSGTFAQTLTNTLGCDSTLTLNLTILPTTTGILRDTACNSLVVNGYNYTISATYTQMLTNAAGCDSVLTVEAVIYAPSLAVSNFGSYLTANATNCAYQWLDCNNGYSPIPGATAQTFTPAVSGNYAVALQVWNCTDTTSCYPVVVIGAEQGLPTLDWIIAPNPTTGACIITFSGPVSEVGLRLMDVSGKVLLATTGQGLRTLALDLQVLPSGIYFVEVVADGTRRVAKVVRQ